MTPSANAAPSLPTGYVTIREILDGKVTLRNTVNVVGVVTDFRVPIPTRRADWKCQLRLIDASVQDAELSLNVNIFRGKDDMPVASCGDVALLRSFKVQEQFTDDRSLLSNYVSKITIYTASEIPKPPASAERATRKCGSKKDTVPDSKESTYVSHMYHSLGKDRVPEEHVFEAMVLRSATVKDKFRLLESVREGQFCDIIAQVVKEPFYMGDKFTLWVTDYTENSDFYCHSLKSEELLSEGMDGDPYAYTAKYMPTESQSHWQGPFGKRSMQITCFEPHATVIREIPISTGHWIILRNLQVKVGHNGANLEGFLREDREAQGVKIGIQKLDLREGRETIDPRLLDALRRKKEYERNKKQQLKDITEAAKAGQKRKAGIESDTESKPKKKNSKSRKNDKRSAKRHAEKERQGVQDMVEVVEVDTNPLIKCENERTPASSVSEIKEFVKYLTTTNGNELMIQLPFVNLNYRSNVRVVDFSPSKLEDFAYAKKQKECAALSDTEEDEDSDDSDSAQDQDTAMGSMNERIWEWRFFLQLEDVHVSKNQKRERIWVAVNNASAQYLTDLDACNLSRDQGKLTALREKLFVLWGDLEERRKQEQEKNERRIEAARQGKPPEDSDNEDQDASETSGKTAFKNRPFSCCIQQYGVKVPELNPANADAGEGKRWQRVFGLVGTRISG